MRRTVLLNCPIKAEIRAVDSQSNLTICYSYDNNNNNNNNGVGYVMRPILLVMWTAF